MITIFTPVYNRKDNILKLKNSLDAQTNKNFEWLIVDDGSTDGFENIVNNWKSQSTNYQINYLKQSNQGKHIAFNNGVVHAKGDWFFCVDSDDYLNDTAISKIYNDIGFLTNKEVGLIYPRKMSNVNDQDQWSKINGMDLDVMDLRDVYKIKESAIILREGDIKRLPFRKFANEKFLPESWLYQKLIPIGKFKAINEPIYISEYLEAGLTRNVWDLWRNNPEGIISILNEKYYLLKKYKGLLRFKSKIKCVINYNSLCLAAGKSIFHQTPSKIMSCVCFFPSLYFYHKRYK